jgi:hypothetical protein
MAILYILWSFGNFFPFWYIWTNKNMATLLRRTVMHDLALKFDLSPDLIANRTTSKYFSFRVSQPDKKSRPRAGLPDFSWSKHTKMGKVYQITTNCTKRPYIIPNGH